jgi:hypothetical protein
LTLLLAVVTLAGCGGRAMVTRTFMATPTRDIDGIVSDLENIEATIEVSQNGRTTVIWSQKNGSWRWEDPDDPEHYVIYDGERGKAWEVRAGSASEITGTEGVWKARSPASFLGRFRIFIGSVTEDRVQFRYPLGKITIEFLGPRNLPSKMVMEEEGSETKILEYTYHDVGDVPDGMFSPPLRAP